MSAPLCDSPLSISPDSTLETEVPYSAPSVGPDGLPSRRSLLADLNAAFEGRASHGATGPDDFDKFRDEDRVSSSSEDEQEAFESRPVAEDSEDFGDDFDEAAIFKEEITHLKAEVQRLRELNVQKANLLTQKEALLQESESRSRKVQQHYERLVQDQMVSNAGQVQERLSISERQARDQSLEIARLQAELSRIHRLEAEVEEKTTMEAELTALLQEKIQETVDLQQQIYTLSEKLTESQAALNNVTLHRDRLAEELARARNLLLDTGQADDLVGRVGAGPGKAPISSVDKERAVSFAGDVAATNSDTHWRRECAELKQRIKEQAHVEQQLKQRIEREITYLTQKLTAEKTAFEQQKEEEVQRLTQDNARMRILLRDNGLMDSEGWTSMQKMIDSLQRMISQQQMHVVGSPANGPKSVPTSHLVGERHTLYEPLVEAPARMNDRFLDDWEASPKIGSSLTLQERVSPSRQEAKRVSVGYPRPTTGAIGPGVGPVVRKRLPSFPPRTQLPGVSRRSGLSRDSTPPGPRGVPAPRGTREPSSPTPNAAREPSPRQSSPSRVVAAPNGVRPARPASSAQSRSTSAPQRGSITTPVTRIPTRLPDHPTEALATNSPLRPSGLYSSVAYAEPVPVPMQAVRIGDRSLATVLRRGPLPPPSNSTIRHPTPTQLDRKRATSAPHLAAKVASPRGQYIRAPRPTNAARHF